MTSKYRTQVLQLYKTLYYMGKEYPKGSQWFHSRLKNAFQRNMNESDEEKIAQLIKRGEFVAVDAMSAGPKVRLADYFVVIELDESQIRHGCSNGSITQRFPEDDWPEIPLSPSLNIFCCPQGWSLTTDILPPSFFSCTLTDLSGCHQYACCLQILEPCSASVTDISDDICGLSPSTSTGATIYKPKIYVILSRFPYFDLYRNCLNRIAEALINGDQEAAGEMVAGLVSNIYLTSSPKTMFFNLAAHRFSVKPLTWPTVPITAQRIATLASQLGTIYNLLAVMCCLLRDQKLIIISNSVSRLSDAAYALKSLLYPFEYSYAFVSILPEMALECLESPTPYIMGVHSALRDRIPDVDACVVDLDIGCVEDPLKTTLDIVPEPFLSRLIALLQSVLNPGLATADHAFQTGVPPPLSLDVLSFIAERGLPYRSIDLFDEIVATLDLKDEVNELGKGPLMDEILAISKKLEDNEKQEVPTLNVVPLSRQRSLSTTSRFFCNAVPPLNAAFVSSKIQDNLNNLSNEGTVHCIRTNNWEPALGDYKFCIYVCNSSSMPDCQMLASAVELSMRSSYSRVALCQLLWTNLQPVNRATLHPQQFDLLCRLINCALENESKEDEHGIAYAFLYLSNIYCRRLNAGVLQFLYTCIQDHAVWDNQRFWETAFFHDVHQQMRRLYSSKNGKIIDDQDDNARCPYSLKNTVGTWNLLEEPSAMRIASARLEQLGNFSEYELKQLCAEEHAIVYGQAKHYINLMVYLRVPLDASRLRRVNLNNLERKNMDDGNSHASDSAESDTESGFIESTVDDTDLGASTVKWISKLIDRICSAAGLPQDQIERLNEEIPGFVGLHIDNLEQVHIESKRISPLHKPKIVQPVLLPSEKVLVDGLRAFLLPDGRDQTVTGLCDPHTAMLPSEGALFLTNYRVVFKGQPCNPFLCERSIVRSMPIMSITKDKQISDHLAQNPVQLEGIPSKSAHRLHDALQIRSSAFQLMKVAFDEEVEPEDVDNFMRTLNGLRWPQSQPRTYFAFSSVALALYSGTALAPGKGKYNTFSYPNVLIVPATVSDEHFMKIAKGFKLGRFPVITWQNSKGAFLARGSGLNGKTVVAKIKKQANFLGSVGSALEVQNSLSGHGGSRLSLSSDSAFLQAGASGSSSELQARYMSTLTYISPPVSSLPSSSLYGSLASLYSLDTILTADGASMISSSTPDMPKKSYHGTASELTRTAATFVRNNGSKTFSNRNFSSTSVSSVAKAPKTSMGSSQGSASRLSSILNLTRNSLYILGDKANAKSMKLEKHCEFIPIAYPTAHNVKAAFKKLLRVTVPSWLTPVDGSVSFFKMLDDTGWMQMLSQLLCISNSIVDIVDLHHSSVVLCIEDGWDSTCQLSSLAQLLLDPYYRTIEGFRVLVEKEWLAFGYRFMHRGNHSASSQASGIAPMFIMFLDAVHQVWTQYPNAFEFNDFYLRFLAFHSTSCHFATFLFDTEMERIHFSEAFSVYSKEHAPPQSVFTYIDDKLKNSPIQFYNFKYVAGVHSILRPEVGIVALQAWEWYSEDHLAHGSCYDLEICEKEFGEREQECFESADNRASVQMKRNVRVLDNSYRCTDLMETNAFAVHLENLGRLQTLVNDKSTNDELSDWRAAMNEASEIVSKSEKLKNHEPDEWNRRVHRAVHKKDTFRLLLRGTSHQLSNSRIREAHIQSSIGKHSFVQFSGIPAALCALCNQPLIGAVPQKSYKCNGCGLIAHEMCSNHITWQCSSKEKNVPVQEERTLESPLEEKTEAETLSDRELTLIPRPPHSTSYLHSGVLLKKGATFKLWKPRWFVLDASRHELRYYDSENDVSCKGLIDLAEVKGVDFPPARKHSGALGNMFELRTTKRIDTENLCVKKASEMRSMRHVRKGQKARAGKNRNAAKNRAHKRQTASKRVWLNKTQFWEPKVVIEEKYLAKVVVGSQESSSQVVEQTKAQKKAKVAVLNQKPSSSQVKDVRESTKKNQKEEVIAQKTTQQSQSANGVPGKKTDVKKTKVEEQLRVEIHEKQYTDNDDMKSSVDSGVDVDHKPAVTSNGAERMAEMTGEVVDAVDEEPCVLKTQIRCGERCGCDRILNEHYHHDHESEPIHTSNTAFDSNTQKESTSQSSTDEKEEQAKTEPPQLEADNKATRFSENVVKFVDFAQKKLVDATSEKAVETKVAPVAAPVPVVAAPAAAPVTKVDPKRRERQYKLLPRDIQFCTYMMETHGDNYEAMANDNKNIYRDTANGIARKLRIFRESPQYEEYLQSKTA
ncbi:hypothetical protein QR680_002054 [Steinernema hermaphroditum]|uniref:Myotubularin-related protein 13 n=1 Tax=Steinernema hermaphroditum TaxID=289476 RepID=A0AA39LGW1_9BILA|nr:hypothetical protein QR680_002054 [Steinernema hermaphroditum]